VGLLIVLLSLFQDSPAQDGTGDAYGRRSGAPDKESKGGSERNEFIHRNWLEKTGVKDELYPRS
jgi:hypothetical protein